MERFDVEEAEQSCDGRVDNLDNSTQEIRSKQYDLPDGPPGLGGWMVNIRWKQKKRNRKARDFVGNEIGLLVTERQSERHRSGKGAGCLGYGPKSDQH